MSCVLLFLVSYIYTGVRVYMCYVWPHVPAKLDNVIFCFLIWTVKVSSHCKFPCHVCNTCQQPLTVLTWVPGSVTWTGIPARVRWPACQDYLWPMSNHKWNTESCTLHSFMIVWHVLVALSHACVFTYCTMHMIECVMCLMSGLCFDVDCARLKPNQAMLLVDLTSHTCPFMPPYGCADKITVCVMCLDVHVCASALDNWQLYMTYYVTYFAVSLGDRHVHTRLLTNART